MNKLYEMTLENQLTDGVFAISLVDSPAIEEDYILLSKDDKIRIEIKLEKMVDAVRQVVSGPILIPDIIIPRKGVEGPYDIVFRKDTIRKLSEKFMMDNMKDNVTLQHQVAVNKVYMVESWIVEDSVKDKSCLYGYNLPVGTWFGTYKINDLELWNEYVASGVLKGFSIEGNFSQIEVSASVEEYDEDEKDIIELMNLLLYSASDLDKYYVWRMNAGEGQCPSCKANNGQVKTLREWIGYAMPAIAENTLIAGLSTSYPHSPYSTFCEAACKCKLVPMADVKKTIIKPF